MFPLPVADITYMCDEKWQLTVAGWPGAALASILRCCCRRGGTKRTLLEEWRHNGYRGNGKSTEAFCRISADDDASLI